MYDHSKIRIIIQHSRDVLIRSLAQTGDIIMFLSGI